MTRAARSTLALLAALAGGCSTAPGQQAALNSGQRQCFIPSQVNGFQALDEETVHVTVGVKTVYELKIAGACPEIDWSQRIGIRSLGGGSWVCSGYDAELIVPSALGTNRCPVLSVRQLTPAETQASRNR